MIANRMSLVVVTAFSLLSASAALAQDLPPLAESAGHGSRSFASSPSNWHYGRHRHDGHGHHWKRNHLRQLSRQSLGGASRVISVRQPSLDRLAVDDRQGYRAGPGSILFLDIGYGPYGINLAGSPERGSYQPAPRAKIIHVKQEMAQEQPTGNGCSFEAGVCVIRGGN